MIGVAPEFYKNGHLKWKTVLDDEGDEINWAYLDDGASDEDKKEFEDYFNTEEWRWRYKANNPRMQNPYRLWNGKIVDKGVE